MGSVTGKGTRRRGKRPPRLLFLSILLLIVSGGVFVNELIAFSQQEDRLPLDVTVGGIDVGGMTGTEARGAWEQAYAAPVILYYQDSPIILDPSEIGFRTNWQTMWADAVRAGEGARNFWGRFFNYLTQQQIQQAAQIPLQAEYQTSLLRQVLEDISARYDRSSGDSEMDMTTLAIYAGNQGAQLNIDAAMERIDAALRSPTNRTVELPVSGLDADGPQLGALEDLIKNYLDSQGFIYDGQTTVASVFIMDLQTGEEINILGDVAMTAASTMKVPIMIEYFRHLNVEPTQDEAWLMANSLLCSFNHSSNLLMQITGGGEPENIFQGIRQVTTTAQQSGATNTFLAAPFVTGDSNQVLGSIAVPPTSPNPNYNTGADPYNQTTAEDMGTLFTMIYDCANYGSGLMAAHPEGTFTQQECRRMLELMSANDLERLLQGGIPENIRISHKNGWLGDTVGNSGIVFPHNGRNYVISVFLWEQTEENFQGADRLWPMVEDISRATWNYFSDEPLLSPRELPPTAQECEGNYLPPDAASVNLDDIDAWKTQ